MNTKLPLLVAGSIAASCFCSLSAFGAAAASDTAANYASSWSATPANLGTGFGAWANQVINNSQPPYVGTYLDQSSYGNPDGVLSAGYAWGTYANGSPGTGEFDLMRPFTAGPSGSTSLQNQTFSIGIGSGGIGGTGSAIQLDIGPSVDLAYSGGGADTMTLGAFGVSYGGIGVSFTQLKAGLLVSLSVSGPLNSTSEGFTFTISPFAGGSALYTLSGTFDSTAYQTSYVEFQDQNTSNDAFVNNPTITAEGTVPEPSSIALLGLGAMLCLRRRK
jgi:hypothetical protein